MPSRNERQLASGGHWLTGMGAPFVVVGVVLALLLDGTARGIGVAVAVLGAIPLVVGIVLLLSAGVEGRSRKDKPFA
jgi:hypothetical protein